MTLGLAIALSVMGHLESEEMNELDKLIKRVMAASGPDRDLDASILCAFPPFGVNWKPDPKWAGRATFEHTIGDGDSRGAPSYTASIDAALALVERCLPLAFITVERFSVSDENAGEWRAWVKVLNEDDLDGDGPSVRQSKGFGKSQTPALAIITALLVALKSQEQNDGRQ